MMSQQCLRLRKCQRGLNQLVAKILVIRKSSFIESGMYWAGRGGLVGLQALLSGPGQVYNFTPRWAGSGPETHPGLVFRAGLSPKFFRARPGRALRIFRASFFGPRFSRPPSVYTSGYSMAENSIHFQVFGSENGIHFWFSS